MWQRDILSFLLVNALLLLILLFTWMLIGPFSEFLAQTMKWCLHEGHRWLGQENQRNVFILIPLNELKSPSTTA